MQTFVDQLQAAMLTKNSVLCVGLDPQLKFMPPQLISGAIRLHGRTWEALAHCFNEFNRGIIDAVAPYACCVKPNAAFYEGSHHLWAVYEGTIAYARSKGLLVINDGKRFDGGDTADAYAQTHIGELPFFDNTTAPSLVRSDAVTIGGYIGEDTIVRFMKEMKQYGTGAFVVDKTSFKPNSVIEQLVTENGLTVWEELANHIGVWGQEVVGDNGYSNLGVVMGATYPTEAERMKEIIPKCVKLVPGYGAQGGDADDAVVAFNDDGFGAVVNSSRGIIAAWQKGEFKVNDPYYYAKAAAFAADHARSELNAALMRKLGASNFPYSD
jgi:orotidine-5'-phosphate decarboxylase